MFSSAVLLEPFPCRTHTHTHTHASTHARTHARAFNGPLSGTTQVSRYQKGKTNLDFTEAQDSEWQWNQLGHMQVCTSLQTDNHASTPPLCFYRPDALPAAQPTASKHCRPNLSNYKFANKQYFWPQHGESVWITSWQPMDTVSWYWYSQLTPSGLAVT